MWFEPPTIQKHFHSALAPNRQYLLSRSTSLLCCHSSNHVTTVLSSDWFAEWADLDRSLPCFSCTANFTQLVRFSTQSRLNFFPFSSSEHHDPKSEKSRWKITQTARNGESKSSRLQSLAPIQWPNLQGKGVCWAGGWGRNDLGRGGEGREKLGYY